VLEAGFKYVCGLREEWVLVQRGRRSWARTLRMVSRSPSGGSYGKEHGREAREAQA